MPEFFRTGLQRILYKSRGFAEGRTVTAYLWDPSLVQSPLLSLTELSNGLYYLDCNFQSEGTYIGLFHENGIPQAAQVFRVDASLPEIKANVKKILQVEKGRWKIVNNQLIIYEEDGVTPLFTFNLKDQTGQPSEENVFERVPV